MPVGKYYCDYCDKEFRDTPQARKRHLQGLQHQRAKALWYADVNNHINPESFGKGVCNRFVRTGSCPYGDSCKYYHPKQNPQNMNTQGVTVTSFIDNSQPSNFQGSLLIGETSLPGDMVRRGMVISMDNLPPSLKPPPEGGYPPFPFVDWG